VILVTGKRTKAKPATRVYVETPSLDPFTLFRHYTGGNGEMMCLTQPQFERAASLAQPVSKFNPNGKNLVEFYGTPLENSFGSATMTYSGGKAAGFFDTFDFNLTGSNRSITGHLKTFVGAVVGAGGKAYDIRYPCQ
jgi:hypothetical protein